MKNITLHLFNNQLVVDCFVEKKVLKGMCLFGGLIVSQLGHAQFSNEGEVVVKNNTILSIYENYQNYDSGKFINDGNVYIFKNWNNDGKVSFTDGSAGKTFFIGNGDQYIEGSKQSDFQNLEFNNSSDDIPFYLGTKISVNAKAEFTKGIIDGIELPDALVIFNEDAQHVKAGDQSFVSGKVQKIGKKDFEFPVGADKFFRPTFHSVAAGNNIYTTQYFHKNSGDLHSHLNKDNSIIEINNQEYWEVKQDQGAEKIVLSLTLDTDTTPSQFFTPAKGYKLAIVRWDDSQGKWVNDGGELSAPISGEAYSNLLTSTVGGYGLFTMALVYDDSKPDDLIIYNALSPNGDGINDTFHIKGIDKYPDNRVEIYNRWGVKVYDQDGYNESDKMFAGYSDGRATINRGEKLPTGTYFYILKYNDGKKVRDKAGYLYINNQ